MFKNVCEKALDVFGLNEYDKSANIVECHNGGGEGAIATGIDLNPVSKVIWKEIRYEGKQVFMGN